ncbi:MAG TPA: alpha/beta hydrolase [Dermatophilaceae bacterium]|nr:alpha/beta hydrolase [Dermatophilaceae bacterium]
MGTTPAAIPADSFPDKDQERPSGPDPVPRGHIGRIVAGSLATGLIAALLFAAAPVISPEEDDVTGAVLCGFALGWAMLAVLSVRFTDQPQRWAAAPAVFMGVAGLLLIGFGTTVREVLNWVWPPALLALVILMSVQAHRQLRSRTRRWLLYPMFAVLLLAAVGGGYETVREAVDANAYPMAGRLIDVGGRRLHLQCTGSGSPTVVLQPGGGDFSSVMGWIAPAVARDTRVCVYDRAGRGWSESADGPQDATKIATDLHTLLQRAGVPGPYVLAGHSFGGLYVLTYADRYPDEVAGMVLVDSTNPAKEADPGKAKAYDGGSYDAMGRLSALGAASARVGLVRLVGASSYGSLPRQAHGEVLAGTATAYYASGWIDEFVQANASGQEAALLTDFGNKPLVVLTAGAETDATHDAAQRKLAALSTNSSHRTIEGASHASLIMEKKYAGATTQAVLDVVSSVRNAGQQIR